MKKTMVSLVAGMALACSSLVMVPGQAVASNCSVGKGKQIGGYYRSFWSYCSKISSGTGKHRAKARMYFDSGYSADRHSDWMPVGSHSETGIYWNGYVTSGPWLQIK